MITGWVNDHLQMRIPVLLPDTVERELHEYTATIDTGLDYQLAMPRTVITRLGYPITGRRRMTMGNEQGHEFEIAAVAIVWDGEPMRARALVTEREFLVGARLLAGYDFSARITPGGRVTIERIAAR